VWKRTPISCRIEAVRCSNSIEVTWRVQLRCDVVFMTSSPSSSPRFSLLAFIFRTTLNKITSQRFQQHLQKAPLCSGISFHLFIFTYSQLSKYHRPSARSKSLSPCSVKTPQYRVRKCVHEGKPRATNRSRVNPMTVQCKVGNGGLANMGTHTGRGKATAARNLSRVFAVKKLRAIYRACSP